MKNREELIKKYDINVQKLEDEQLKLARQIETKDSIDFSLADRFGAIDITFINNKILCCVIVCDKNYEVIERAYSFEKVKFPYLSGFRAYRELPAMISAFDKLGEKPDIVFIPGPGIADPKLGLASHFSLATGVPSIGVSDSIFECEINGEDIIKEKKKIGKLLSLKQNSRPMYISPGNKISIETAFELSKKLINLPHKRPEPLHLAGKYSKEVKKELNSE
jgi:deoxyribonuclease V